VINLNDLKVDKKTAWFEYRDGLTLELELVDRNRIRHWTEKSRKVEWDKKHQKIETTDNDKWVEMVSTAIVDWSGLTTANISRFGKYEAPTVDGADAKVIGYSPDNAKELLFGDMDLQMFVFDRVTNVQRFEDDRLEDEKKS